MSRPLLTVIVLAAATAAPAAPVPKEAREAPAYYATQIGAKLVYQTGTGSAESTEVVTAVESKDGAVLVSVSRDFNGRLTPLSRVSVSKSGLVKIGIGARDLDAPQTMLKVPVRDGDSWEWALATGRKTTLTAKGIEEVEVPAGKYRAARVDGETDAGNGRTIRYSYWYAPGVGLVKQVSKFNETETVRVLKTFTAGKD